MDHLIHHFIENSTKGTSKRYPFSNPSLCVIEPAAIFLTTTSNGIIFTDSTNCSVSDNCLIK